MSQIIDLLKNLREQGDDARCVTTILEWTLSSLPADGIALLAPSEAPSDGVCVRAAHGSLAAIAPLIAAEWSRTGMPREQGMVALPAGAEKADAVYCCPVRPAAGQPGSALALHGHGIQETVRAREEDLLIVVSELGDAMENERAERQREREAALAGVLGGQASFSPLLPGLSLLTDGLRLPLYVCDGQGRFRYASPGFLELTGHPSLEALCLRGDFFGDPKSRADELETIRSLGKVGSFPLVALSGSGKKLEIRDSAVSLGESVLGVFFDVTALMAANAELKDALQVQELLNDSIMAGAQTLQRTQGAAIRTLARLAEYRDPETGFHLQRICEYTRLLALEVHERSPYAFRITREYGNDISLSSMLHDIGKVSIPDNILLKPGKLDPPEWEMMKKHTFFGWEVLHKADKELGEQSFLTLAATIALSHHERYDGSGYPNGSAGEQIPLSARISAVADVYDALTTARPYKPAWSHEQAAEEILRLGGSHFDPVLVEIFRDVNGQFADVRRQFPG
ncbi:MAG: HD domain-containing phosphohydrolase [Spirochaetia bacterium]